MAGSLKWEGEDQNPGQPEQKAIPYLQNNQGKNDWRHGSSSTETA
jgi:hypothetical protein